jgi:hypothetical protein
MQGSRSFQQNKRREPKARGTDVRCVSSPAADQRQRGRSEGKASSPAPRVPPAQACHTSQHTPASSKLVSCDSQHVDVSHLNEHQLMNPLLIKLPIGRSRSCSLSCLGETGIPNLGRPIGAREDSCLTNRSHMPHWCAWHWLGVVIPIGADILVLTPQLMIKHGHSHLYRLHPSVSFHSPTKRRTHTILYTQPWLEQQCWPFSRSF